MLVIGVQPARTQLVPTLKNPRISLGISAGAPEAETELPLKLTTPGGMTIARLEATVEYPGKALEFDKVTGYAVAQKLVAIDAKVAELADGKRTVTVRVDPDQSKKTLPAGELVLNLVFRVAKDTEPEVLNVHLQAKAFAPGDQPIESLEVYDGRVNIQPPELFYACFFYMH